MTGDSQYESVLHLSSGVGNQDPATQLMTPLIVDDALLCPGDWGPCAGGEGIIIRYQFVGDEFKVKYWSASLPEPSSWSATGNWNPPASLHHWAFALYGGSPTNSDLGGAAIGSLMIRSLPEGGTDALVGSTFPSKVEVPVP
jgi:hypothetical protein